jgi:N-acylneuraminate cytidylyltransferase
VNPLVVIPARAGSSRLKDKNLQTLDTSSRTLIDLAAECALEACASVVISTDYGRSYLPTGTMYHRRPEELCGPTVDICDVTKDALQSVEYATGKIFTHIVTLQPATPLRSPTLLREMLDTMERARCNGAITMAKCVPWTWKIDGGKAENSWFPRPYPRSQEVKTHNLQEINCVQISSREAVLAGKRWDLPLLITELPPWAVLDIDTPEDLEECRRLWPALQAEFNKLSGFRFHVEHSINGAVA